MRLLTITLVFGIIVFLSSCAYTEKATTSFEKTLYETKLNSVNKVRTGGAYQNIQKSSYNHPATYENGKPTSFVDTPYLDHPVFFFDSGYILYYNALSLDANDFISYQRKFASEKWGLNAWGVYTIDNDTINATIYIRYSGTWFKRRQLRQSYFQGIIINKDTIQGWRMIPPYPAVTNLNLEEYLVDYLTTPKNLLFKPVPVKALPDPSKAWINEFRHK